MASVNKVILIGNLGRDPELRRTASGNAICNVTIATSRNWKERDTGERREETEWHRVVFFDRLAEIAGEYLRKGRPVYVEGRLKTRKWQDREGQDRYTTEIVVEQMQLLGSRDGGGGDYDAGSAGGYDGGAGGGQGGRQFSERQSAAPRAPASGPTAPPPPGDFSDMDDDIPF